jgi:glyoxylase-like metal-dependent hydrolase (beta-lactamase superfamily II)
MRSFDCAQDFARRLPAPTRRGLTPARRLNFRTVFAACIAILLLAPAAAAQTQVTYSAEWCRHLPRPEYKALERVPVRSDWFEVYRVRPGVFALYEPHQAEEVISYLIGGSRKALLFDTGMGIASIRGVVRQLTRLPVTVLNSHTHYDHVGGNREFSEILGMDTAFTRERAAKGYFNEVMRTEVSPENLCGPLPKGFDPGAYHVPPFRIARTVRDGTVIDLGDRKLEVIAVPGHTPDSIALLDRGHRLLFTGDTLMWVPFGCSSRRPTWQPTHAPPRAWRCWPMRWTCCCRDTTPRPLPRPTSRNCATRRRRLSLEVLKRRRGRTGSGDFSSTGSRS